MLDTLRYHETPEGIDLELHLAGLWVRASAWTLDALIRLAVYIGAFTLIGLIGGDASGGLIMITLFLVEWFYPVVFEVFNNGATPGKKAFAIRVIHDNGTPVAFPASFIRNLLRTVDFLPLMYGVGMLSMLINRDFKRLGDIVAGTVVIYNEPKHTLREIPQQPPRPLPVALSLNEQRAILDFAERSKQLSPQRTEELADILSDVTGLQGAAGVERLHQYANWLQRG